MFSIDHYLASIQTNLENHTTTLVKELQKIVSYKFDAAVDLVDFSAFTDPTSFEISIRMFSMDKDATEVFGEEITPNRFAGSVAVLADASYYHLQDHQRDICLDFYEQNDEELAIKEQQIFTEWFIECWDKAGGKGFNLPAYFGFHDETPSYYLQNARFVEDEEKWV